MHGPEWKTKDKSLNGQIMILSKKQVNFDEIRLVSNPGSIHFEPARRLKGNAMEISIFTYVSWSWARRGFVRGQRDE